MSILQIEKHYVQSTIQINTLMFPHHDENVKNWTADIKNRGDSMGRKTNLKCDMTKFDDLLHDKNYNILKDFILWSSNMLQAFNPEAHYLEMSDLWGAVYNQGDEAIAHHHLPAVISFVYYLKADPILSSPLLFPTVNNGFMIRPTSGLIVMFPGYLEHYVPPQQQENERIVLAGNLTLYNRDELWETKE